MATLQVKNLPDELHARLRDRAAAEHLTLSDYVTRLLRRDLSGPSLAEWLAGRSTGVPRPEVDVLAVLDEVRAEPR
ncbi:MAG: hypothetical protein LC789_10945 [Actinobacteria bacterium]|nr:hypothetical protein [Actinomycetota bacterium]MCA1721591.1 hypothetical protein [Actinomycetota bacterium]